MGMAAVLFMCPRPFEQNFIPACHGGSTSNFVSNGLAVSQEKKFDNVESE